MRLRIYSAEQAAEIRDLITRLTPLEDVLVSVLSFPMVGCATLFCPGCESIVHHDFQGAVQSVWLKLIPLQDNETGGWYIDTPFDDEETARIWLQTHLLLRDPHSTRTVTEELKTRLYSLLDSLLPDGMTAYPRLQRMLY